ncbi:hypothetical protein SKAU_G00107550 [Synaphobranchus kaupii]|uniref:Laminin subunit alpha 5 n=1 Tax=Synaphobranchus kaupii TaxID=118154 RepID=A0A9Q1J6Z9_SYNKA|nr:hypothetical protein SKAU_G00107550 [Synaphobranchus kaupii]
MVWTGTSTALSLPGPSGVCHGSCPHQERPLCQFVLPLLSHCSLHELPTSGVNGFSLHPPYFNLAEAQKSRRPRPVARTRMGVQFRTYTASLWGGPVSGDPSQTIQGQYCDTCTMGASNRAHPITNAIDGTERWWQSPPLSRSVGYNEVNVTLDLGQLFHVAYVLIKFANSPRPDLWVLERSIDFGETYQPWQFFASSKRDCIERFGQRTIERINKDNDIVCTTEYSRIVPLENGEIVVSLVNGRPGAMNFSYSPVLRDFTKATNIRLRFLRTNTLLGHLMGKALRDPTVTRRYYYSIKDISIGGRCVCNGHAEACNAKDPNDPYRLQCDCQHNTCGPSCDRCCSGFNQVPWKPATTYSANECEPVVVCAWSASTTPLDSIVSAASLVTTGHLTTPLDSPFACSPCACQSEFTDGTCADLTGRCYCKPNYTGRNCDTCAEGYVNFQSVSVSAIAVFTTAGEIIHCECNAASTEANSCRPDPRTHTCVCKPGFMGDHCDSCAPRFFGLNCQACQCSGPGCQDGTCDTATGQCYCRSGFQGYACERCSPGYFNYPLCQLCGCSTVGSLPEGCDVSGRCLCRPEFQGPRCQQCRSGFHSYPNCQVCSCDPRTSLDSSCSVTGHCHCRPNFSGTSCDQCAPGFFGYPSCTPCQCSIEGSRFSTCDKVTGQCACRPSVVGQRCDSCGSGSYGFPVCQVGTCNPAGSVQNEILPTVGTCECRPYVEGIACDKCKALFWNLSPDTLYGCSTCECNAAGTLSNVAECAQNSGQCYCKPNVCSGTCSVCKDGYFNLQGDNYLGCQGCQCDIGGSAGLSCAERNGRCQCRPNIEGLKCNQPKPDHYFPDLHHLKFEIEDGTVLDGRPVRFGYNPLEFEGFSWRGYAQMSPIQPKVVVAVSVSSPDLFHIVLRYVSRGSVDIRGRVSVLEDGRSFSCGNFKVSVHVSEAELYLTRFILRYVNTGAAVSSGKITAYQSSRRGSDQSKQIVFAPSLEPTFVNVPQNNFVEPFVLNPGTWTVVIEAEGILLDYLVLLPSAYYEAPILQMKVTEACTYSPTQDSSQNCLLYKYLTLDGFPSISGNDASCRFDNHLPRPCQNEKITPRHPSMAICSGSDINVQLRTPVPQPGKYVVVVEYSSEDETPQALTVSVNTPGGRTHQEYLTLLHCKYSFLCRGVSVDDKNRVAIFTLSTDIDVQFIADRSSFFLYKVYLIPHEQFTMEYLKPKVHCISTHGTFAPDSGACIPSRFQTPSQSLVLKEGQASLVQDPGVALPPDSQSLPADSPPWAAGDRPPNAADSGEHVRLDHSQNAVVYSTRVQSQGGFVFILHYHQPLHPTFTVQVFLNGGRIWQGIANATFCPHGYGCRSLLMSEDKIILDVTDNEVVLTVQVPDGKTLWLDYILVVPEGSYSSSYLNEEPLDKSYDFISNCGQNSFYINPVVSSPFCRSSAVSLSAFFNNGALPCGCHEAGAGSDACEPFGGQCQCRPNIIGRDCSQCATGYWGFPNCRPCNCGTRLCEQVTGECICPPRTMRPECVQCEPQAFGCHPLVGCEVCNCSRPGITSPDVSCDTSSGQCRCKNNIIGRQCDRCSPGFYGYPNCRQCDCNEAGTENSVCDAVSGQCLCKENVEGARCDQCRVGTFHLDPTNPKGCTSCFCFGATDRCRSSEKRRTELVDMNGWVLLGGERQEVPVITSLEQGLVEADLGDVPDVYQDLHWHAPRSYLGDKVSSYGGYFRYRLHSQAMRGDVLALPAEASRPDVILKGNQMTLVYLEREYSSPGVPHEGTVHLVEGSFRHAQTGNVVSREELMMVLVGLESLQIRALHSQSAMGVGLSGAVLEGAESSSTGRHTSNVEICLCPANYQGDSCQQCGPGYYRDTKGLFLGKCVPCNCNSHSDQCLDGTGVCVAASNNFAVGCVEKPGRMQCLCMPGYAGPHCERCAPGFYGNPMVLGSTCQPCQCHDNTDPNMLFSDCHPLTGDCQGCMHNSAGSHCQVCAPGFYGEAVIAKNCTKCNCSPCGTDTCDPHTGQCHCKPGVTGAQCHVCENGAFGYETCAGCQRCDCDAAAALVQPCDPRNGTCACQPGVNGPHCRQCAPGYWDYGPTGCKKCSCKAGLCDPRTGECRHSVPVQNGAEPMRCHVCDSCVIVLLEDLDGLSDGFVSVRRQLANLNASSIAWAQLYSLDESVANMTNEINNYNNTLDESRMRADMLESEAQNINSDIDKLQEKVLLTSQKADNLADSSNRTQERATDLLKFIKGIMGDIGDIMSQVNRTSNVTDEAPGEELAEKLAQVEAMLREMRFRGCQAQKSSAEKELSEAQKLAERVKDELVNRLSDNQNQVQDIRAQLGKFHTELMDLRDALNEAVNSTARAADTNNMNMKRLEESRQKVEDLEKKQKEVYDHLQMAVDAVTQVNDLLSMLQDSKEEYERLAAQLDGARRPLAEKVQKFSPTVSKIPLVEAAEKHAELLDQLARNLSSVIEGTNQDSFIQRALNASRAYTDIIDAVRDAEAAALDSNKAAMDALEKVQGKDLGQLADTLKNKSNELVKEATDLQDELSKDLKPELQDKKARLKDAKEKQESLLEDLEMAKKNLNISREETAKDIQEAKQAAAEANSTTAQVEDALSPIKKQLDEWQQQYGDSNTTNEDINNAFMEANKSVGLLGDTIPLLIKKLDKLQNRSAQMPNISENIDRIRQLIAQARNAANKVKVPVKFNGTSGIQVRNPSNLADLAAYNSLKFYITLPESGKKKRQDESSRQFVLYLGNKVASKEFLGMSLEGKKLRWVYNLGGETAEVIVDYNILSDGNFNNVNLERILQYGQIAISDEGTVKRVTKREVQAKGDSGLLNLSAEDTVFYVGGYPDTFTPPKELQLPNFKGCIEMETLNEEVLSLYNFERTFQLDTTAVKPCGRTKPVLTQQWVTDAAYFDGTGYAEVTLNVEGDSRRRFEQEVRVLSQNGIIMLLLHQERFLCLAVQGGQLKVFYNFAGELKEAEPTKNAMDHISISNGQTKPLDVIILYRGLRRLTVRINRYTVYSVLSEEMPLFRESYYLGGVPKDKLPASLKTLFPDKVSIKGCFRKVKAQESYIDIKRMNSSGVSYGCSSDLLVSREAHFTGTGYLGLGLDNLPNLQSNFYTGLGFRTDQKNGLMLYHVAEDGVCQVLLDRGHVVVKARGKEVKTQKTYNDANSHYVTLYSNNQGLRVYVDDMLESSERPSGSSPATTVLVKSVYLGGTPEDVGVANLSGCVSNLFIKHINTEKSQMVVNLLNAKENVNVPLSCPAAKGPQQVLASSRVQKNPKGRNKKPQSGSRNRSARGSCQAELSAHDADAVQFSGSSHSYLKFDSFPEAFRKTPHFSMGVRVNSSDGLIFYVSGEKDGVAMTLSVSGGHFVLLIDGGRRKASIRSRKKYSDNQWHTVFVRREGEKAMLVVDGINVHSKKVANGEKSPLRPPLYVGGLPSSLSSSAHTVRQSHSVPAEGGFAGCIRDVRLNEEPLGSPSQALGVVPCFQDGLQPGVYFSSQGGHLSIDEGLMLGRDLEILLEVRPVSDSGLLLHAGGHSGLQLSLYLNQGEVTVLVNNGNGEFSASFTPEESLCNGRWHSIGIVKKSNVIQLDVDTGSEHGIGPKKSRPSGGRETVYLGGAPDTVDVPGLPSSLSSFHGCVRRVVINQRPTILSKPLSVHGAVGTQGCPPM